MSVDMNFWWEENGENGRRWRRGINRRREQRRWDPSLAAFELHCGKMVGGCWGVCPWFIFNLWLKSVEGRWQLQAFWPVNQSFSKKSSVTPAWTRCGPRKKTTKGKIKQKEEEIGIKVWPCHKYSPILDVMSLVLILFFFFSLGLGLFVVFHGIFNSALKKIHDLFERKKKF